MTLYVRTCLLMHTSVCVILPTLSHHLPTLSHPPNPPLLSQAPLVRCKGPHCPQAPLPVAQRTLEQGAEF